MTVDVPTGGMVGSSAVGSVTAGAEGGAGPGVSTAVSGGMATSVVTAGDVGLATTLSPDAARLRQDGELEGGPSKTSIGPFRR